VQVAGQDGVPSSAVTGVAFTTTAVAPTTGTWLTVRPTGLAQPLGPDMAAAGEENSSTLVLAGLSSFGQMTISNASGTLNLLADVAGYFTSGSGSVFHAVTPLRLLDTRNGTRVPRAPVGPGGVVAWQVTGSSSSVPAGASAVVVNIGATDETAASYLTLWSAGQAQPATTNLSFGPSGVLADLAIVALGSGGAVDIYNASGSTDVFGDVVGYFK